MKTIVKDGIYRTVSEDKANDLIDYKGYRELTATEKKAREPKADKADK
jgi:hypothetical protein